MTLDIGQRRIAPTRRGTLALLALPSIFIVPALAADRFPNRPIKLIVPFPPGNTADIVGRILAEKLRGPLGQGVIVDNRAGAAGILGTDAVAKADNDGHTLLLTTPSPIVINPAIYKRLPYSVERDFIPVAAISMQPMMLVANARVPASNLAELVAWMKREQDKVNYASVGPGTFSHLGMEMFSDAIEARPTHIPYKGAAAALADLIGGQVSMMLDGLASANAQVMSGRVKAIAVTSRERTPYANQVPTVAESGIASLGHFEITGWVGLFAPAGTPASVIQRIKAEIDGIVMQPNFGEALGAASMTVLAPRSPEQFVHQIRRDAEQWARAARVAKLDPNN